jgi:hypothetical protein
MEDTIEVQEKCIRLSVPIAKGSAKSLSSPEKIARYIARTVFPSTKMPVVKGGQDLFLD